ncbi:MAG TPA: DNA repair exonuclease [Pirellulales bacterium]|nr:DNA repair exonuclease [Pirellulales bacterium]
MFKFIHAADIHLDSQLKGLERYDGAPVDELRGATRRALENLVRLAIDEEAAFLLIAGDLYDGDWQDHKTGLFFADQMLQLREAGIRVVLISGNHDAANRMTRSLRLPDNVLKLSAKKPQTEPLDDFGVSIHGQGFATAAVMDNLAVSYPKAVPGQFNIGLLHTCGTGREGHERYAPCALDDLRAKGYDYWALGHIHQRERLCNDQHIYFAGNLQGRHIRESGAKGCLVVSVDDRHNADVRFEPLDVVRWDVAEVDAAEAHDGYEVLDRFSRSLRSLLSQSEGRMLAVRVEVRGRCRAHEGLAAEPLRWANELRVAAREIGMGNVWLEKIKLHTSPASLDDESQLNEGPLGELIDYIEELRQRPTELSWLAGELAELKRKLPAELQEGQDAIGLDDPAWLASLLENVQPILVSRLLARAENA